MISRAKLVSIAAVCYAATQAYRNALEAPVEPAWELLTDERREQEIEDVEFAIANPDVIRNDAEDLVHWAVVKSLIEPAGGFCPWDAFENANTAYLDEAEKRKYFEALAFPPPEPGHRWAQQRID